MESIDHLIQSIKSKPLESTGDVYHPIPFQEFNQLKSAVNEPAVSKKFQLIRSAIPIRKFDGLKLLDVGANAGYFTYKFEELGAKVDAIEPNPDYYQLGEQVSSHYKLNIDWHNENLNTHFLAGRDYNITLMLSVFQWISQGNSDIENAKNLLRSISTKSDYLFFELGCNWGNSAIKTDDHPLRWISSLLQENTVYSKISYLGSVRLWGGWRAKWRYNRYLLCGTNKQIQLNSWQKMMTRLFGK